MPDKAALCTLEPLVAAHAQEMFGVLSDPAIYAFENAPPPSAAWLADRHARLERRTSPDGSQAWLNRVVRLPGGALAGYAQATVLPSHTALVAYELAMVKPASAEPGGVMTLPLPLPRCPGCRLP